MPRFLGVEVQTDVRCASGARRAFFPAGALLACSAVLSPTEPESLTVVVQRSDARVAELVAGRVLRTCFSDTTADREWDLVQLEDNDTDDQLTLTAHPIALRLARKLYETVDAATGAPIFDFAIVGTTAADAIDDYVLPTLAARGMSWVARGTVDATATFDLSGQWASILEIVRAIAEPGRANGEWQLRRNGDTDYKLDVLTSIGASAGTLRVRTQHNLLAHQRSRSVLEAVTRVCARGSDLAAPRTMAEHLWRVASKGTDGIGNYLELEDIAGGADPILEDGQLDGRYVGSFDTHNPTLQLVTDSRQSTQRVYMSSTAQFTAGRWCRFLVGSTTTGQRLTSLTSPTAAAAPTADGLGDLAEFLDVPEVRGDCNLVPNPWMRDWTTAASPPDDWTVTAGTPANLTQSRETTTVRESPYTLRLVTTGATTLLVETPDIPVWAISGRRHFPALWFYVDAVPAAATSAIVFDLYTAAGVKIAEWGRWVRNTDDLDTWLRAEGAVQDLSGVTGKVRIRMTITTTTGGSAASGWDVLVSHAMLAESEIPVDDIEYSGGTLLWQRANVRLAAAAAAVRGQELTVADLEADDPDVFAALAVTPGQSCELTDTVLAEVTTQRVLEYRPDYLEPLASQIRVGVPALSSVKSLVPSRVTPADAEATAASSEMVALEASFDEDGQLFVRVVGDADTRSVYCVVSASGEPTEATLMQATPTNGRQAEFSFAGPYTLGETVYIAARGASRAGGRGGLSDVIRARVVRGNAATSKTIRLAAAAVLTPIYGDNYDNSGGYYSWTGDGTGNGGHVGFLPLPKGATLTAVRARCYTKDSGGSGGDLIQFLIYRVGLDGAQTAIGSGDQTAVLDTWETFSDPALAEDTDGDRAHLVRLVSVGDVAGAGFEFRCAWIEYDLDVPNLTVAT